MPNACPCNLAIFIAASFASHPELQKNVEYNFDKFANSFPNRHCSSMLYKLEI